MALKTSVHIKPCNIGQSEAHNERTKEYLAHINASKIYIRQDLTGENQSWRSESQGGMSLQQYYDAIGKMVKEKTGRAMQTKVRERVNKKTGKVIKIGGCSPLREGVIVCKENTTMEQLHRFADLCHERFGITALQIHLHKDEGHYADPNDKKSWKANYHAHIVWDWMNHETGRSYKLNTDDICTIQDLAAEALGMERGESKAETGAQHLERNDYIVAKQKAELEAAKSQTEQLTKEKEAKDQQIASLDQQIKEKKEKADKENGNAILSGIAKFAGKGKYAQIAAENASLKQQVESMPAEIEEKVSARTSYLEDKLKEANDMAESRWNSYYDMKQKYDALSTSIANRDASRDYALSQRDITIENLRTGLRHLLQFTSVVCQNAVNAVISFACRPVSRTFTTDQASAVNEFLSSYSSRQGGANELCSISEPFLENSEYAKAKLEIQNVVDDWANYSFRISREKGLQQREQPRRRGLGR